MSTTPPNLTQKNRRLGLIVLLIVMIMVGLAFASVPLYSLFCRVTGFAGTTQVAVSAPNTILEREVTILFNADVNTKLPWGFAPEVHKMKVPIGQEVLMNFIAKNNGTEPVAGTALYNVTPPKVGQYFNKTQCFCFNEQILQPGETMNMPVLFFVDPSIADDPYMDDVKTITLSYTFFKTESTDLDKALDDFYNAEE